MTKSFDDIVSNFQDPRPEWTVVINGKDYSNNLELLEFSDSVNNPLKFTVKLSGVDSTDSIPEDAEVVVKRAGGELFRGVLKQVEPNVLNEYTFKGTGYAAELEGDVGQRFEDTDIQTVIDSLVDTSSVPNSKTFSTSYSGGISTTTVNDFRANKKQLSEANRVMGEYDIEWYTTYDGSNEPVFNVTDQISFTDGGNPKDTLTTYGPNQSAEMVKQNANRNKGSFDGVLVRGYGDGDDQITATAGSTGKGNRVLIYTDKTILTDSQAQKRADNINSSKSVAWQEVEVKPSDPNKIYGVGDELAIDAEDARLNDTYRVVESYFKFWPGEDEVESRLMLSNKPQTFVDDFKRQEEQTDSQTDYSQGNRNTINESVKELADSNNPAKMEFNIPKRFTEDVTGKERTAQVRLDYVVDNYREDFTAGSQTTSTVIDSQTDVVSTEVNDFGDISRSQTKKEPRDTGNNIETTSDFTQTDVTAGGGGAQIDSTEASSSGLSIADGGSVSLFDFDGGTETTGGAVLYYQITAIGSVQSGNYKQNNLRVKVTDDDFGDFPDFDGVYLYYSIPNLSQLSEFDFDPNQTMEGAIFVPENTADKDYSFEIEVTGSNPAELNVDTTFAIIDAHKHGIPDTEKGGDNVQAYTFAGPEIIDIPADDEITIRGELESELENLGAAGKDLQQVEIVGSDNNNGVYGVDFVNDGNGTTDIDIDSNTLDTGDTTGVVQYDIPSDKNSSQSTQSLPNENNTDVLQDVDAGDLILSEGATEATDVEIIVNGTSVTTESLSSGPPYTFEDEDITSEVTKPGFNTVEIKPTGGTENGKALVKGNVVVDHKIEGERQ